MRKHFKTSSNKLNNKYFKGKSEKIHDYEIDL